MTKQAALPFPSVIQLWIDRVRTSADTEAYRDKRGGRWQSTTWRAADDTAREIAGGLLDLGLRPGDRVCLLAETRLEWLLVEVGVLLAGGVVVPIFPSSTPEQCRQILGHCGARLAVVEDAAQLEKLLPILLTGADLDLVHLDADARLARPDPGGRTAVSLREVLAAVPREAARRIIAFDELRARGRRRLADPGAAAELARRSQAAGPDDPFTIIYTSGTTGSPKGVVLSHGNLVAACASATRALHLTGEDLHYVWLTLAHVFAREIVWATLMAGAPVAFSSGLQHLRDDLTELRPTFMAGVPRIYEKMHGSLQAALRQGWAGRRVLAGWALGVGRRSSSELRAGRRLGVGLGLARTLADRLVLARLRSRLGLDRARFLISGGAPLDPTVAEFFHALGLLVLEGYGLTETTGAAFVNRIERFRFGTVGPPIDVVEHRLADDGELLLRGPSVFTRYHADPAATAEAIEGDGWFHTGDVGIFEDGFLRITDRKKDLIVLAGGKKVAPQPLETALKRASPLLSHCLVYGDRRSYCVALLTLTEEAVARFGQGDGARAADHAEVQAALARALAQVNSGLAGYESIKAFAVLPEDFSEQNGQLTPSLKVKRKVVIERHRAAIEKLYGR